MAAPVHPRFFIALLPPQTIQDQANEIKQYFADRYASRAAQKSPPHITLQPPFEWPLDNLTQLAQELGLFAVKHNAIPITLNGFAAFPPRVIFIDVHKSSELLTMQQELSLFLKGRLGLMDARTAGRAFAPHMTVAFRDLTRQNFEQAWPEFAERSLWAEFMATHLALLMHTGQRWVVHREFPFQSDQCRPLAPPSSPL